MSATQQNKMEVFEILQGMSGLEPLKELFWSRLSYERVNKPLSRAGWSDAAKNALAEDPLLWASGGAGGVFHVIYARMASTELKRTLERPVVESLLREHPYSLFIFSNDDRTNWHFLNVKYDDRVEKRRLFRRIAIGPFERLRTATERIQMLDLEEAGPDIFRLSPLAIQAVLALRIQEIHDTIGEDAAILDKSEKLNENAMYAIYLDREMEALDDAEEEFMDLNEAEEFFRNLSREAPDEYERILNLRDGIRSAKRGAAPGLYVFCQAGRYNQLFLVGEDGKTISRDLPRALEAIKATPETPRAEKLPKDYNGQVMRIREQFVEEVKHQQAQRQHTMTLQTGQKYVLRELRVLFGHTEDEDERARINEMEKAFRMAPTSAVKKELNLLRRNGATGATLLKALIDIYHQHHLCERLEQDGLRLDKVEIPRIVCSEALI
ncbi:MAG: hypothetical protein NTX50_26925 [Candidatus Sumerlaeota bacterium]|nr:hypothetical protein [Candidatus Sumerlaeota bacterium]